VQELLDKVLQVVTVVVLWAVAVAALGLWVCLEMVETELLQQSQAAQ
jgi:hypothetical protein